MSEQHPAPPPASRSAAPIGRLRTTAALTGGALGVYLPFVAVALTERGLSVVEVGLVMSLGAVGFLVAVPAWGHVADVILGRPRTLALVALGAAVLLVSILAGVPPFVTGILYVAATLFTAAWQPLTDAIVVNVLRDGPSYVRVRLFVSLSYAVAAAGAGVVYAQTGFSAALGLVAAAAVVIAVVALGLPDAPRAHLDRRPGAAGAGRGPLRAFGSTFAAMRIAPPLPLFLAAVALALVGLNAGNTFIGLRILELGGGSVDVALASSISAATEVPVMLIAGAVAVRVGLRALFVGCALMSAAAAAAWASADSVGVILASRTLVGIGFGGIVVAGVMTMRSLLPDELQGTGQSLFQATCFGLAAVVANAAGGILHERVGYTGLFAVCAALGVASAVVGWVAYARAGAHAGAHGAAVPTVAGAADPPVAAATEPGTSPGSP